MTKLASPILAALFVLGLGEFSLAETFSLDDVELATIQGKAGGGTLTGTFTLNSSLNQLLSADIIASSYGMNIPGFEYTYSNTGGGNSTLAESLPSQYFQLDSGNNELRIYFASPLTVQGAPIKTKGAVLRL